MEPAQLRKEIRTLPVDVPDFFNRRESTCAEQRANERTTSSLNRCVLGVSFLCLNRPLLAPLGLDYQGALQISPSGSRKSVRQCCAILPWRRYQRDLC